VYPRSFAYQNRVISALKNFKIKFITYLESLECAYFDEALALFSKMEDNGCIPNVVRYETIADYPFQNDERDTVEISLSKLSLKVYYIHFSRALDAATMTLNFTQNGQWCM
jgi:hypothetical protein